MKDQYVGDVNDYAKYALCRALTAKGDVALGVWWMRTPDDGRPDGALTGYLARFERWSDLDPELYVAMKFLVAEGKRSVQNVERSGLLAGALFWPEPVPPKEQDRWLSFTKMLQRFRDRDLVLFDPDMGIEVPSVPQGHARSCQYVYWGELTTMYAEGHSLLIFQYFPRVQRQVFTSLRLEQLAALVGAAAVCCAATPRVAFFLAMHERHRSKLRTGLDAFAQRWQLPVIVGKPEGSLVAMVARDPHS